jgi:hypothetical protein
MLGTVWKWVRWVCCGVEDENDTAENPRVVEEGGVRGMVEARH